MAAGIRVHSCAQERRHARRDGDCAPRRIALAAVALVGPAVDLDHGALDRAG